MSEKYYDEYSNEISKEEFDRGREEFLAERLEYSKNKDNLIPFDELDYYLDELEKYWK
ncbi:MAG: hypothetical protein HRT58_22655 [Crocinitomicaceae bacterium]|nr:hypothetical protein [Flavobacteriales bacterium]NQZ38480.1 hypothetical protein [Crocinitomicaceae bacterium]